MQSERDNSASERYAEGIRRLVELDVEPEFHSHILNSAGFVWEVHNKVLSTTTQSVFPIEENNRMLVRFETQPDMLGIVVEANTTGIKLAFIRLKGGSTEEITPGFYEQSVPVFEPQGCLLELINNINSKNEQKELWGSFLEKDSLTETQKEIVEHARQRLFGELAQNNKSWVKALRNDPLAAMNSWVSYGSVPNAGSN